MRARRLDSAFVKDFIEQYRSPPCKQSGQGIAQSAAFERCYRALVETSGVKEIIGEIEATFHQRINEFKRKLAEDRRLRKSASVTEFLGLLSNQCLIA